MLKFEMPDVPHYFLYGETAPSDALDYLFIASLEQSLPKHNWEIHPHRHDNLYQLLIVEEGQVNVQIREMRSQETGQSILSIPPKEVHGFIHNPGIRGYIVTIVDSFLHGLFSDAERQKFSLIFNEPLIVNFDPDSKSSWDFEILIRQIVREYRSQREGQACVLGAYLKILFVSMARASDFKSLNPKQNDPRIKYFEDFQALLEQHYMEHYSVNQYAEKLGMTTGRLNRMCQRYAGQNAMQIIHGHLISEAKRKLIYVDSSMNEIAYDLGFKDPAYFSRFFSKHCGEPPGKYRARLRDPALV
ncbi:MAG: helix-turn-helix domain-containing protein [Gammaproteobacteria bacterium]|nr:helix-turn-helix domain-containing protein [Gammaproteobacteria bacterium]